VNRLKALCDIAVIVNTQRTLDRVEFAAKARLHEKKGSIPKSDSMLAQLLADHEHIIRTLREDIEAIEQTHHDKGTGNFLTDIMEKHEKMAWMLRASVS
jgi:starvation-inducible DNA-binding protein